MTINHVYNPRVPSHIFPESARGGKKWWRKKSERLTHSHTRARTQVLKVSPQTAECNMCACVRSISRVWRGVGRSIKVEIYKTEPGGAIHGGRNGWRPARYVCYILLLLLLFFLPPPYNTQTAHHTAAVLTLPGRRHCQWMYIRTLQHTHHTIYIHVYIRTRLLLLLLLLYDIYVCVYYISLSDIIHSRGTGCTSR